MKTALILTGHMRCFEQVFPNTFDTIINPYQPDIFITTWDNEGWWTSPENDPEKKGINSKSPPLDLTRVSELYKPVQLTVFKQGAFDSRIEHEVRLYELEKKVKEIRPRNIVSQFLMWNLAFNEFHNYLSQSRANLLHEYDLVIRMRSDLVLPNGLPKLDPNVLNFIHHTNHEGHGYGDMFLASDQSRMIAFNWQMNYYYDHAKDRFCPHMIMESVAKRMEWEMEIHSYVHRVNKTLMHTPKGQYQDV